MRKPYFSYKQNQTDNSVDIHIYGVIGYDESYWDEGTNNTAYSLVSLIKRLDKNYDRLNIHINSPGGFINDGLAIYNTLKACKADVHTYNSGFVGSMASIIILAGITHFPTTSIYHLHRASSGVIGNINDMEAKIEALKVYESTLQTAIAEKTGLTKEEVITNWFDGKDHFMTAEDAKSFGFVDNLENETIVEPPVNLAKMQDMKYDAIVALYDKQPDNEKENFLTKLKSFFTAENKSNHNNKNHKSMKTLKAGVTALIAFLALSELKLNDENNVELSIDEAINLNTEFEKLQSKADELELEKEALIEEKITLESEITALKAKIEGTEVKDDTTPKTTDVTNANNDDKYTEISDEISNKIKELNKKL